MSISENKKNKAGGRDVWRMPVLIYGGYSLFLLIFSLVYQIFAHGVHSFYMTWLPCFTFIPGLKSEVFPFTLITEQLLFL